MGKYSDQAKGRAKQAAGDLLDDDQLRREGKADEVAGKAKETLDHAKKGVENVIDEVKEKTRH